MGEKELVLVVGDRKILTRNYYDSLEEVRKDFPESLFVIEQKGNEFHVSTRLLDATYECRTRGKIIPV